MKKGLKYAWLSFLGSFFALMVTDYTLRNSAENISGGGINFFLFWMLWIPFLIFSLYWLVYASKKLKTTFSTILFVLANLSVATLSIIIISLLYTVGAGIDSL